jgi:hypothetical protein
VAAIQTVCLFQEEMPEVDIYSDWKKHGHLPLPKILFCSDNLFFPALQKNKSGTFREVRSGLAQKMRGMF